jgi:hypothetical protein
LEDRVVPALFQPAITAPTGGNGPFAVTVANLNGDALPDIAVTNFNSGTLSVGLGNGAGNFSPATGSPFAVGASASAVTAADFNNDGLQDIAVADPSDNRVMFFFGSGFGGNPFNLSSSPFALQAADFNHDGFADVAVGLSNGQVRVIFGAATFGSFTSSFVASGTGAVTALATGDYNNDGNGDIAVVRETGSGTTLSIYFGDGHGAFSPGPFISMGATRATSMVAGDFRGVGRLDLAIANFTNNTITIVLNDGGGTFETPTVMPVLGNPFWLVAADFNRDGRVDLIKSNNANNSITPLIGNGDGTFVLTPSFNVGTAPKGMAVGDFNSDGRPDLVVVNSSSPGTVSTLMNSSLGIHFNFSAPSGASAGVSFSVTVTAADISNNPMTGYRGTIHFTSSDGSATLPTDYTFTSADNGSHTFTVTLQTGGDQTIVATDTSDATIRGFTKISVTNPPPSISSLGTTMVVEGSASFTLTVNGSNFVPTSVVKWNGTTLTTTFISSSQLSAVVPAANLADEGSVAVTVVSPPPGGGTAGPVPFTITDAPLTLTGKPLTAFEGLMFTTTVATLTDANPIATTADFNSGSGSVMINWGDSTTNAGTVVQTAAGFLVQGTHAYAEEGMFMISITVTDDGGSTATTPPPATANIVDAPLTLSASPIKVMMGVPFNGQVATFTDVNPTAPLSDFMATIDWGDGTTTSGVITQPGGAGTAFSVSGMHTYISATTHIFTVTVTDAGGSSATGKALAGNFLVHDITGRALESGQWWTALSNGSSLFNSAQWAVWSTGVTWVDVVTGDFNGDGKMDIAGRALQTGQWWVGLSNGTGFNTTLWNTWSTGVTWVDVKVGDFTGDGKADIAGRALESGQWWVNQSTGASFNVHLWTTWSTGATWVDVQVGDFTGDGKADLMGRDKQSGNWWLAQSTGTSFNNSLWTTWSTGVTWVDVNVGDFNGDGKADIAGRAQQSGQWWVSLSTGSTTPTTSLWTTWSPSVNWVDVKIGDFNGDGSSDIIGRNQSTGQWWVSYSNGSTAFADMRIFASWSTGGNWVDVQVGDFNADGRDDLAARDRNTGKWFVALSNGTTGTTSLWAIWSTGATWVDVHTGAFA